MAKKKLLCPFCNTENAVTANNCANCGQLIPDDALLVDALQLLKLVQLEPATLTPTGWECQIPSLDGIYTVGRAYSDGSQAFVPDIDLRQIAPKVNNQVAVSKLHAMLRVGSGQYTLERYQAQPGDGTKNGARLGFGEIQSGALVVAIEKLNPGEPILVQVGQVWLFADPYSPDRPGVALQVAAQ